MMKKIAISLLLTAMPLPALACGPTPGLILWGLGFVGAVLSFIVAVQSRAFRAAKEFMKGITPDRGAPYWLAFGLLIDAAVFYGWIASGLFAGFGIYLLVSGLPKLLMTLTGATREFGALREARPNY
jgi:hypothetical protein